MGIKIKHTDPTLNEFATDDLIVNVQSGSLFFKSNTKLFKLQGDDQSTTDTSDSLKITGLISSIGSSYVVELNGNHGNGPRINMGTSPTSGDNSDHFMTFGAFASINNLDTKSRDFHLYGTNTTTGFYFDESTGKFGIGITAPTALLHLGTQGAANQNTDPSLTRLALTPPAHTGGPWNFVTRDSATHAFLDIDYGVTNKITINSDGDMGIGTTTPKAKLSVYPDTDVSASIGRVKIGAMPGIGSNYAGFAHYDVSAAGDYALLQASDGETYLNASLGQIINFRINNSTKMVLSGSNVGIGTTAPTEKLTVTGNISASGVGTFGSLDISGNIDVDGTTNLDVVDIDGTANMASTLTMGSYIAFPNVNWNDSTSGTVLNNTHILNTALSFPLTGDGITLDYGAKSSTGDNSFVQFRLRDNISGDSFRVYFDDYQGAGGDLTYDKIPLEVFGNKVLLCQDNYGSVGIYTNSPIAPLTVRGNIASGGVSTGGTDQIVIHSTTNGYGAGIGFCDHLSGSVVANQTYANGQKGHLRFFHTDVHNDTGTGCVFKLSHENATSLALDVEGNVVCATLTCTTFDGPSDINLKTNVNNIDTPLETILKLKGITFEWKEKVIEKEPGKRYTNLEGTKHGFIAQEVEKVLPDLINDEKPYKSLNYIEIIPILVEAMKEQQKQIDELKRKINEQ